MYLPKKTNTIPWIIVNREFYKALPKLKIITQQITNVNALEVLKLITSSFVCVKALQQWQLNEAKHNNKDQE